MGKKGDHMMGKKFKKFMAAFLAVTVLTGCSIPAANKEMPGDKSERTAEAGAKAGQLADYFMKVAEGYVQPADRNRVLEGMEENGKATRLQMLVIAGRAFAGLPQPEGNAKRTAPPAPDLTEMPDWAQGALQNLSDGGILAASDLKDIETGKEDSMSEMPVSMRDARIIAARLYAAFGTDLKDDFYTAVNGSGLNTLEIPEGQDTAGGSASVTASTDEQLKNLILEIVNSGEDYPKGSPKQKIRDLYQTYENTDTRSREGIEPLQKYLDAVEQASSFSELNAAIAQSVRELGNFANGLLPGIPVTDTKDSSRKVLQLMTMVPGLTAKDYENPEAEAYKEYRTSLISQLMAAGENPQDAKLHADGILKIEKELAESMEGQEESGEITEKKYYTPELLDEMMPQAKLSELLAGVGLEKDVKMIVFDDKQFETFSKWFTDENLELFKAMQKIALLTGFSSFLSDDLAKQFGTAGIQSADMAVQYYLSEELGKLYTERYFPAESKAEVEKMTALIIDTFKKRVQRLEWMEEKTKKEALKKLDTLTVLIGYPDEWQMNHADIQGIEEGGSYFKNVAASEVAKWDNQLKELQNPVNPRKFSLTAYTVNAAASRSTNTIIFPAGILQAPFYDKNASFEANLGAIGSTIAHEITHMFDDGGAQYDAKGNVADWWEDADYSHFQKLCRKVEDFYNGCEAAPGIAAGGKETLSENIADIGGIACTLDILSEMENPDYDAFFRSYANQWMRAADYETLKELADTDMHAPNNLRCNLVLSNFQEFYDTYGIQEGDGMYTAPEDRITIW